MLEAYQAFADYHDMMELTESLVVAAARAALDGSTTVLDRRGERSTSRSRGPASRWSSSSVSTRASSIHPSMPVDDARAVLDGLGLTYKDAWGAGRLTHEVYDELVEPKLVRPTFVLDHPRETSPLARAHRDDPTLVERFEVVVDGSELANAYSELNDPIDQRERFEAEARARAAGDRRGGHRRRGLPPGARVRPAADRGHGHRHRPARHAARRRHQHPRSDPLPHAAPRAIANRRQLGVGYTTVLLTPVRVRWRRVAR